MLGSPLAAGHDPGRVSFASKASPRPGVLDSPLTASLIGFVHFPIPQVLAFVVPAAATIPARGTSIEREADWMQLTLTLRLALLALLTNCALAVVDPSMQLSMAILKGQPDKVAALLASNPGLGNQASKRGYIPLQGAVGLAVYKAEVVNALISGGADPNLASVNGQTPLGAAISAKNLPAVTQLLQKRAIPDKPALRSLTPLHWATLQTDPTLCAQMIEQLLLAGAKPDLLDPDKHTPLHTAILRATKDDAGGAVVVEALLKGKANPNLKLQLGRSQVSVLEYVKQFKLEKTQEVLIRYGAK